AGRVLGQQLDQFAVVVDEQQLRHRTQSSSGARGPTAASRFFTRGAHFLTRWPRSLTHRPVRFDCRWPTESTPPGQGEPMQRSALAALGLIAALMSPAGV